jgi:hypothetical protein
MIEGKEKSVDIVVPLSLMIRYLTDKPPLEPDEKEILLFALYIESKITNTYGLAKRALDELKAKS